MILVTVLAVAKYHSNAEGIPLDLYNAGVNARLWTPWRSLSLPEILPAQVAVTPQMLPGFTVKGV